MNPRLAKELRPLLLPWSLAAIAAAGHFVGFADPVFAKGEFGSFITGLAVVAFVVGCLVLTALPLGTEVQERTLALLFSQPADRAQLWKEKLLAATIAVVTLGIIHGLASVVAGTLRLSEALLCVAFMAAAICSVGYWTLAAQSVLLGIACAFSIPVWIAGAIYVAVYHLLGIEVHFSERTTVVLALVLCLAYCTFFLWLGRRQFAGLELKDGAVSRAAQIPEAFVPAKLTELFRCRPAGAVANLIRKEIRLQKPIFLVGAIFTVSWLLNLVVMVLRPDWHANCVGVFNGLTGTQVVLMVILTGCVSLADDKALGTAAWHLSLPLSTRRQWLVKLLVAAGTAVAMSVVLPTLLAALTLLKAQVGLLAVGSGNALSLSLLCVPVFVLSFWSASIVANTVRAALTCMLALICMAASVASGFNAPESFFTLSSRYYTGLQSGLITHVLSHFQLPPDYLARHAGVVGYSMLLSYVAFVFAAMFQSLKQFRRVQTKPAIKVKYALLLAAIAFGGSFWCADLIKSSASPSVRFNSEIGGALAALPRDKENLEPGKSWTVTPKELEQTGKLSDTIRGWLKDTRITVAPLQSSTQRSNTRTPLRCVVSVTFPRGTTYSFIWN